MTYMAKMQDGAVVFVGEKPEDGCVLRIEPVAVAEIQDTVGQRLLKFAGLIQDGPTDGSVNVDHYLYGLPKK